MVPINFCWFVISKPRFEECVQDIALLDPDHGLVLNFSSVISLSVPEKTISEDSRKAGTEISIKQTFIVNKQRFFRKV